MWEGVPHLNAPIRPTPLPCNHPHLAIIDSPSTSLSLSSLLFLYFPNRLPLTNTPSPTYLFLLFPSPQVFSHLMSVFNFSCMPFSHFPRLPLSLTDPCPPTTHISLFSPPPFPSLASLPVLSSPPLYPPPTLRLHPAITNPFWYRMLGSVLWTFSIQGRRYRPITLFSLKVFNAVPSRGSVFPLQMYTF